MRKDVNDMSNLRLEELLKNMDIFLYLKII